MKQHLQEEIDKKLFSSFLVQIKFCLNLYKINEGQRDCDGNATAYYHKMQQWFLNDLTTLLGQPQRMTYDGNEMHFSIDGRTYFDFIDLCFDRYSGKYKGLYMIMIKKRKRVTEYLTPKQMKEERTKEVNSLIVDFAMKASSLGYFKL